MTRRVLLTGAAGYIGSVLVPTLLARDWQVTVVDRFFFGQDKLPPAGENLRIRNLDTRNLQVEDLADQDAVIDFAAISNDPAGELDPELTWSINERARVRCADLCRTAGVPRYILPSSSSVYGQQEGLLAEDAPLAPRTAYAQANASAERGVLQLATDTFTACVVRQATVFGLSPRMRMDLALHQMVLQGLRNGVIPVLGDGSQWRPFVHIRDVAAAFHTLLTAPTTAINGQTFNVGGDQLNVTIRQVAEEVGRAIGVDRFHSYGSLDDRSHRMDFGKIHSELGFTPSVSMYAGALEVADAITSKSVDPDDPSAYTVRWYQHLIDTGVDLDAPAQAYG